MNLSLFLSALFVLSFGNDEPNYFIDLAEKGSDYQQFYPWPIDKCLQTGFIYYDYVKYTCNEAGTRLTKTYYDDVNCETLSPNKSSEVFTDSDGLVTGAYAFNCKGVTSYASVEICIVDGTVDDCESNECILQERAYWAVDVCHYSGNGNESLIMQTKCDSNKLTVNEYQEQHVSEGCGIVTRDLYANDKNCTQFTKIRIAKGVKWNVYAQLKSCIIDGFELVEQAHTSAPTPEGTDVVNPQATASGSNKGNNNDGSTKNTLGIIAIIMVCLLIIGGIIYYVNRKKRQQVINVNGDEYNVNIREVSIGDEFGGTNKYSSNNDFNTAGGPHGPHDDGLDDHDDDDNDNADQDGGIVTGGDTFMHDAADLSESNNDELGDDDNEQNNENKVTAGGGDDDMAKPEVTDGNSTLVGEN